MVRLLQVCHPVEDVPAMARAASAASDALRASSENGAITWNMLYLALKILQKLPPAITVRHHEAVAALLVDGSSAIRAFAAHTLACMGPEAVADHFEEIVGIVERRDAPCFDTALDVAVGGCVPAAWLCVCVLLPIHLLRLEARGAPVRVLCDEPRFADAADGILIGDDWRLAHEVPEPADVRAALDAAVLVPREAAAAEGAVRLGGPIIQDVPSQLAAFVPTRITWSPATHAVFPHAARARAVELLYVGHMLRRSVHTPTLPSDLWTSLILPKVIERRSRPGGVGEAGRLRRDMQQSAGVKGDGVLL